MLAKLLQFFQNNPLFFVIDSLEDERSIVIEEEELS